MAIDNSIYGQSQGMDLLGNIQKGLSISNSMKDQKRQEQQALAQQQATEQQALAERKQKEVQLLARSGRGVKDQAGYDSLLKTAKFMGHDISQLPPQWGPDAQGMIASLASNELGVDKQMGMESDARQFDYTKQKDNRNFANQDREFGLQKQRYNLDATDKNRDYEMRLANMGLTREQFEEQKNQNSFGNNLKAKELALMEREKSAKEKFLEAKQAEMMAKSEGKTADGSLKPEQAKQLGLYQLGAKAEEQYRNAVADKGEYDPASVGQVVDNSEWAPNWMKNDKAIEAQAAQANWVEAFLRDASGAAIPPSERGAYAKDFFAQPGDPESVIANKQSLREQKMENARLSAGGEKAMNYLAKNDQGPRGNSFINEAQASGAAFDNVLKAAPNMAPNDQSAFQWASQNSQDPRAQKILMNLNSKYGGR